MLPHMTKDYDSSVIRTKLFASLVCIENSYRFKTGKNLKVCHCTGIGLNWLSDINSAKIMKSLFFFIFILKVTGTNWVQNYALPGYSRIFGYFCPVRLFACLTNLLKIGFFTAIVLSVDQGKNHTVSKKSNISCVLIHVSTEHAMAQICFHGSC